MALEPLTGEDPAEFAGYRLRARLGTGAVAQAYLGYAASGRPVALKVARPEAGLGPGFRVRFRREMDAARRVRGHYTARVLAADPDTTRPWLATAYVAGPSLRQVVAGHGPLPDATVLRLVAGVAAALRAMHRAGVIHRYLEPGHVLLTAAGPQLIDCPMTRAAAGTALIWTGQRAGTTGYLAPEQLAGRAIFPSVDVFGLGSLATYASLGRPPCGEDGDPEILYRILHGQPDLGYCTEPLRGLIERCLAKQAGQRPGPAAIIGACRAASAGTGHQPEQPWLPPTVAALLPSCAAPPAPPWAVTERGPSRRVGPRPPAVPTGADAVA